ncbi:MAG TPA: hypothetical protein VN971_11585, partial [Thermoanaerobaculia bacterium]|nr:hypothetical protein [Thermoanaerobaculia bacterium]
MDDRSLWKKELSLGRRPKEQENADDSAATDEKPTSMWKKELSLKREPKAESVEGDAEAEAEVPADDPVVEKPAAEDPVAGERDVAEETVWKKEVSFGLNASEQDTPEETEPVVAEATSSSGELPDSNPEPAVEEKVWKKEVSFSRKPSADPVPAQPADIAPVVEEA